MTRYADKSRVQQSFFKSMYSYNQHAEAQTRMAEELLEALRRIHPAGFARVLEIGCGSGLLTERFLKSFPVEMFCANDLVEECGIIIEDIFRQHAFGHFSFVGGDIEAIADLPDALDLILSNATFQWLHDFDGFAAHLKTLLKPNGLLAFSTFGTQNCREIRTLTGNSLTYRPFQDVLASLQTHFDVLFSHEETITLHFASPMDVLRHLRLTGVNGVSSQKAWTKADLAHFEQAYRERFGEFNRVPLTYHPMLFIVRAQS
ncbi:biotin biosynthesis protein BioC [Candidatus Moduliflexus flocculans]|uniref:Malonyl-[acyl-carrier protein] O-methyltransferase n=1 Tax=Candidatus Moduliflexus flocculans TaxID=1499966 RepID=A0A0S6VYC3_9BACT|nr:biotin biosynthesis protein BioC [Candidatus Moduliflexus flocculans]